MSMVFLIDALGWIATCLFVSSFLVKKRSLLHILGLSACVLKMVYTYHYGVWPLFVNWVVLFFVDVYQWWSYRNKDQVKKGV